MSASLVGSEMCIRDSPWLPAARPVAAGNLEVLVGLSPRLATTGDPPVSYTHLTLPTICSV
eukprot:5977278-Alexandrium_andersonii.AAC.1